MRRGMGTPSMATSEASSDDEDQSQSPRAEKSPPSFHGTSLSSGVGGGGVKSPEKRLPREVPTVL